MLMWLRNKRRQLAAALLTVFTAGLLSIVCQNCLADSVVDNFVSQTTPEKHCMQDEEQVKKSDSDTMHDQCLGVCDCDESVFINASEIRLATIDAIDKHRSSDQQIPFYVTQSLQSSNLFISEISEIRSFIPDRACYTPLERYCVLLI